MTLLTQQQLPELMSDINEKTFEFKIRFSANIDVYGKEEQIKW